MSSEGALRDELGVGFELIETMRWELHGDFLRGKRHLARIADSAATLGFSFDPAVAERALASAVTCAASLRVRLALSKDGKVNVTTQPFVPLAPWTIWKIRTATTRLTSTDTLLRHKTTLRQSYEIARAEYPSDAANEVILLNEENLVCEGTITSLFIDRGNGGQFATPALACGLLAGVLRCEMIENGEAEEADLTVNDLARASRIFVGNSLHGLIAAKLVQ